MLSRADHKSEATKIIAKFKSALADCQHKLMKAERRASLEGFRSA
jgi:hypothetical protein